MRTLSLNERRLIELVASKGPLARTDLSRALGLTGATVTRIVTELSDLGLFDEKVDRQGRGGQPKRMLSLRPGRYFAAGLTISRSSFELALLDMCGEIIAQSSVRSGDLSSVDIARLANATLAQMLDDARVQRAAVVGVGCAMPGNFDEGGKKMIAHGVFADLDDPATLERFRSAFDLPILLENDGTSAAIGEHVYGQQPDDGGSLFFIHLGHGVGGGAVVNGTPFRGVNGNACLPGFLFPYGMPRPSGLDLMETLARSGHKMTDFSGLEGLDQTAPALACWIDRAGPQLAQAALAATAFFDPSVIVVGGRLPTWINELLVDRMQGVEMHGPSRGLSVAPLRAAKLGPQGGAIGAACQPLFATFFGGNTTTFGSAYLDGRRG